MATLNNVNEVAEEQQEAQKVGTITSDSALNFEPTPFNSFGNITRLTNKELCTLINSKFQETFHDMRGSYIEFINGHFITSMVFENNSSPVGDGKIKNLVNLTKPDRQNMSYYDGMRAVYHKTSGMMFDLNDETKLLLSDFMFGGRKANSVNDRGKWAKNITCIVQNIGNAYPNNPWFSNNAKEYIVKVTGLDLRRILRNAIFGDTMITKISRDSEGNTNAETSKALYEPRYIKHLPGFDNVFVMNIEQFDSDAVEKFITIENPQAYAVSSGMVKYF